MMRRGLLFVLAIGWASLAGPNSGYDVAAGGTEFPRAFETQIGAAEVKLIRTGTAIRVKGIFKVYAVASYLEEGARVRSAAELVDADRPKQLQLVFLREVSGRDMAETFRAVLRQNHPAPAFVDEVDEVMRLFQKTAAGRGDRVVISHIPKVGLHCRRQGKEEVLIKNVAFSKAVWENYLGKKNVGNDVKRGLISELRTDD